MHSAAVARQTEFKRMRGPSGFGDALYVRPIADYIAASGVRLEVLSNYPDIFRGCPVTVSPFSRAMRPKCDIVAHYVSGKNDPNTNQWQDMCKMAGVPTSLPLRFDWTIQNPALVEDVRQRAQGRKVVLVHGGRSPMARTDGFGAELLPDRQAFATVLETLGRDCYRVRIGHGSHIYPLAFDLDLWGHTSIADVVDLGKACDGIVGPCSFVVPLAEAFDKPLLAVWAGAGLRAPKSYVKTITPKKIFSKASSRFVMDDWKAEKIREASSAFRNAF